MEQLSLDLGVIKQEKINTSYQNVIQGDCLEAMRGMESNSIDCILTDPPYGLKFMGKKWDHGIPGVDFWKEALRIAKPGAMLLAFGGTRTHHRLMCAIEDAGWEIRDCISWVYGSGFPKSLDISKSIDKSKGCERNKVKIPFSEGQLYVSEKNPRPWKNKCKAVGYHELADNQSICELAKTFSGYGTALKPAHEPIIVAMKPLDGTFANNAEKWGVAGINVDISRIGNNPNYSYKNGKGGSKFFNRLNPGYKSISIKCRWPSNIILDEAAAAVLDEMSGNTKSSIYDNSKGNCCEFGDTVRNTKRISRNDIGGYKDSGGPSRFFKVIECEPPFFYCAKASSAERGVSNNHPCVKPVKLLKYLLQLIMPPNPDAIVLDMFAGSGSTLVAARELGYNAIGIELEKEYCEIAEARL